MPGATAWGDSLGRQGETACVAIEKRHGGDNGPCTYGRVGGVLDRKREDHRERSAERDIDQCRTRDSEGDSDANRYIDRKNKREGEGGTERERKRERERER